MTAPLEPFHATHDPWLVALSALVAAQGAYVGLSLAGRMRDAGPARRRALLAGAALALAVGVWSMHFIGMLAARTPVPVDYLVAPTVFSFLVCVTAVGAATLVAATAPPGRLRLRLGAGGLLMGAGVVSMHHVGMGALAGHVTMSHSALAVAASAALAVGASTLALWLLFDAPRRAVWASAIAMGLAVSGMHYTAMAGTTLRAAPAAGVQFASALSPDALALTVACVAFAVSAAFLLTLAPAPAARAPVREPAAATPEAPERPAAEPAASPAAEAAPEPAVGPREASARAGPLGGAGRAPARPLASLTVEKAGASLRLPAAAIRAVRANAHYTYVSDGEAEYFCALSIGEVEASLDPASFLRVHRSHIVNLDRVTGVRRAGDAGVVLLEGGASLPVARARLPALRRRIEGRPSPAPGPGPAEMGQHA